jgi:hypothetical protein
MSRRDRRREANGLREQADSPAPDTVTAPIDSTDTDQMHPDDRKSASDADGPEFRLIDKTIDPSGVAPSSTTVRITTGWYGPITGRSKDAGAGEVVTLLSAEAARIVSLGIAEYVEA